MELDLSLDEIIKKNNFKKGSTNSRGRLQNRGNKRNNPSNRAMKPLQSSNNRVNKPTRGREPSRNRGVKDARLKIIQKTRQRLMKGDAREKLAQIAKFTDARSKIKGRNSKVANLVDGRRNRIGDRRNNSNRANSGIVLQRSIKNQLSGIRDPSSLIRCTINRPVQEYPSPRNIHVYNDLDMPVEEIMPRLDISNLKVVTQNNYLTDRQNYAMESRMPEPMYIDKYDAQPFRREMEHARLGGIGMRMSSEMRARLDSPAKPPTYYSPAPNNPPPQPEGHRIVVSNLHASVTHEDVKELFEDIGPLITSRLVRAGTAEVIYKFHKDAKKAVEAYHNRQLDGQPMKCLLVHPQGPRNTGSCGVLRSSNLPSTPKYPSSSKSMVVPDVTAIHKALFMNK